MRSKQREGIFKVRDIKDEMLSDAIATAFEFAKKNVVLKRIIVIQCVIIALLLAALFCR